LRFEKAEGKRADQGVGEGQKSDLRFEISEDRRKEGGPLGGRRLEECERWGKTKGPKKQKKRLKKTEIGLT
jgi:hypothetical protein